MILKSVLDDAFSRLTTSKKCEGYFGFYEVSEWPKGLKQGLEALQILTLANPVRSLECPGCEEGCFMPVDILSGENGKPGRAFISCDKTANLGRIPIKLNQLVQWKMTGNSLAKGLRAMFRSSAESDMTMTESGARWAIVWFKGKKKRGQIFLTLDKRCK